MLKTPWTLSIAILIAVALLDPGNFMAVLRFAAAALAHTGQYILFAVLLLVLPQGDRGRGHGGTRL